MLQRLFRADRMHEEADGMTPRLRTGFSVSAALHVAVLLVLLLGLPHFAPKDDAPPETTVAMVFQGGPQAAMRADTPARTPAPSKEAAPPAPPVTEPPKQQPVEAPPLPPPPPPPPPMQAQPAAPTPSPPVPTPPAPSATRQPSPVPPPPDEAQTLADLPPPPPAPPPSPAPAQTAKTETMPLPIPPPPVPPPPSPPSRTLQPNPTRNATPNSTALENTLEKLRQEMAQSQPPKARPNPRAGGAGGGSPTGSDTAALTADQRGAIGDHVRECWTKDAGALDAGKQQVLLTVTTDAGGIARRAVVAGDDAGRLGDPRFRAFAERAVRAIMDPHCANLPLPSNVLGRVNVLTFRFSP